MIVRDTYTGQESLAAIERGLVGLVAPVSPGLFNGRFRVLEATPGELADLAAAGYLFPPPPTPRPPARPRPRSCDDDEFYDGPAADRRGEGPHDPRIDSPYYTHREVHGDDRDSRRRY